MTLKLMKYELRASLRIFAPVWAILIVLGIVNSLFLRYEALYEVLNGIPAALFMILFVVGVLAASIVCMVFLVMRFYKGLLKDEGYLIFTLPVKTSQILNAKLLSAVLLEIGTAAASIIAVVLMLAGTQTPEIIMEVQDMYQPLAELGLDRQFLISAAALANLSMLLSPVFSILKTYVSMAIGQLSNKGKVGISVLVYLGLNSVESAIMQATQFGLFMRLNEDLVNAMEFGVFASNTVLQMLLTAVILMAVLICLYYFLTWIILKNKLNLE